MAGKSRVLLSAKQSATDRKMQAMRAFVNKLLRSPASGHVAKVILFGSLARGEATPESDIDLIVIGTRSLSSVKVACLEAALDTILEIGEDIEPVVRTLAEWQEPSSWLLHRARIEGKEVYSMDAEAIKRKDIEAIYELASMYVEATVKLLASGVGDEGSMRLAIDGGYNVIELCAKAFLLSRMDVLPKSHGGVKALFSDHFIKSGVLPRELGRRFSHCLQYPNEARYDPAAEVTKDKALTVASFAGQMVPALEKYLVGLDPQL